MIVALLRHGRTAWNEQGRLQGRADLPLAPAGEAQVDRWRVPPGFGDAIVVASPLVRAVATAQRFAGGAPRIVPDLIEMDWGAWEGETFATLRAAHAGAFAAAEARGLDFRPPGGESLREVQQRLLSWLALAAVQVEGPETAVIAVTHRGVLNALVAHLTGWNGIGRPPVKPRTDCAQVVAVDAAGRVAVRQWNVPLVVAQDG